MIPEAYYDIGWLAAALTIAMFIPQVIKILLTKDVETLSTFTFSVWSVGASAYVILGSLTDTWAALAGNASNLLLLNVIFFYIFRARKQMKRFFLLVAYTTVTIVLTVVFATTLSGSVPLAVSYVIVIVAGGMFTVSFVPQVRRIFFDKDFRSYSFVTSVTLSTSKILWVVYWLGFTIHDPSVKQPIYIIALILTALQVFIQLLPAPFYFIHLKKKKKAAAAQRAGATK